jgi:uncharacterized protein
MFKRKDAPWRLTTRPAPSAGFCRNCLSNWMKDAADARGVPMSKDESRETIYGMPYEEWKAKHQKEASKDQQAAFEKAGHKH